MYTYEFEDLETGENFFVEADDRKSAITVASQYFCAAKCYGRVSGAYAEMCGYDTY